MRIALVPALAALALAVAGASPAATAPKETKWIDSHDGFSIILPPKWYAVPRSAAAVQATITAAKKAKIAGVATAYSFYLTAAGKQQLKDYVFQALLNVYPSTDPIIPQISIQLSKPTKPYKASDLANAGATFASVLAQNKGAKVATPVSTKLPEGTAELVTASIPITKGLADATSLYLIIHAGKLYVLKFDIDAAAMTKSATEVFRSIAVNFRFV